MLLARIHVKPNCVEAYLELARAPYGVIRRIGQFASRDDLQPILSQRSYFQWRSLAILILAQQADTDDRKYIEDHFRTCSKFSLTINLGAWAAAYIELNGNLALDQIEREYLSNPNRTAEEIEAVLAALSIHGRDAPTHLRRRIEQCYDTAARNHPLIVDKVSKDLAEWSKDAAVTERVQVE
jgi:hypothetical protein